MAFGVIALLYFPFELIRFIYRKFFSKDKEDKIFNVKHLGIKRDYDKEPIILKNYNSPFVLAFMFLLYIIVAPMIIKDIQNGLLDQINTESIKAIFILIAPFWIMYDVFFKKTEVVEPISFHFSNESICFQAEKDDKSLIAPTDKIKEVAFCIIPNLPEKYGRLNFNFSWKKSKSKMIFSMELGEMFLFLFYTTIFLILLPLKIYQLTKHKEPYGLLRKNIFIVFENRNYFVLKIQSQKDFDDIIQYFLSHEVKIKDKTYFIPHLQNKSSIFVDKNEIWSDDFNDTHIPKNTFKRKLRKFLSIE